MTIPDENLIEEVTELLIESNFSNKHYQFSTIRNIDNIDVKVW
jgi:hypothetical protein